jgi:hypothetical protein
MSQVMQAMVAYSLTLGVSLIAANFKTYHALVLSFVTGRYGTNACFRMDPMTNVTLQQRIKKDRENLDLTFIALNPWASVQ